MPKLYLMREFERRIRNVVLLFVSETNFFFFEFDLFDEKMRFSAVNVSAQDKQLILLLQWLM